MFKPVYFLISVIFSVFLFMGMALAQGSATSTLEDAYTPVSLNKGNHPLGAYGGGNFDSVNLFNNNLSMSFPLASLSGRAGNGAGIVLSYNSKFWTVHTTVTYSSSQTELFRDEVPITEDWDRRGGLAPGWQIHAGKVIGRTTGFEVLDYDPLISYLYYRQTITRFTFIMPDGTEHEFRDALTDGRFFELPSGSPPPSTSLESRGLIFKTSDGTSATFVIDEASFPDGVHDTFIFSRFARPAPITTVDGMIYLRDGTRFRIEGGLVKWQMDRNGNRITFEYDGMSRVTKIVDTLGREITVQYFDGDEDTILARVTVLGTDGAARETLIKRGWLRNNRTDGTGAPLNGELFPSLDWEASDSYDVKTVKAIQLPSGHEWSFRYNKYAEVSRVTTPGGGVVEYESDFGAMDNSAAQFNGVATSIFRRTVKRKFYPNGLGQSVERAIEYSDPSIAEANTNASVTQTHSKPGAGGDVARIKHDFLGSPRDGLFYTPLTLLNNTGYPRWSLGREVKVETFDVVNGVDVRKAITETEWEQRADVQWATNRNVLSANHPQNDTRVKSVKNVLTAPGTNSVSQMSYQYDQFNNVKQEDVYDFGPGAPGALLRQVRRTFKTAAGDADYWEATVDGKVLVPGTSERRNVHLRSLLLSESVWSSTEAETTATYEYDVYSGANRAALVDRSLPDTPYRLHGENYGPTWQMRGNVTNVSVSGPGLVAAVTSYSQYDVCGSVVKAIGPLGASETTTFSYDPVSGDPASTYQFAYPTSVSRPVTEADGTAKTLAMSFIYDFWTGNAKTVRGYSYHEGLTGDVTTYEYSDVLDRLTAVQRPAGAGRTEYVYSPAGNPLSVTVRTLRESPSQWDEATTVYDGLFRAVTTTRTDPGPGGLVQADTKYDTLGRPWLVTNPYRPGVAGPDPTDGWTRTFYDSLGRATEVATFSGRAIPDATWTDAHVSFTGKVTTAYDGASVTVTDQAGKQRKSDMDALQRIKAVYEPVSSGSLTQATTYSYDARGNLTLVQQGAQQRKFAYDALSRLLYTKMPEQVATINEAGGPWSQKFVYDAASNLQSKIESRAASATITTAYTYDEVNRVRSIDYSNTTSATPDVIYFYDYSAVPSQAVNSSAVLPAGYDSGYSMGRLRGVVTNATTGSDPVQSQTANIYSYDAAGRVTDYWQLLDGQHYQSEAVYNAASQVKQETYPSGAKIDNTFTSGGFLTRVQYTPSGGAQSTISDNITYTAAGGVAQQQLGNGLWHAIAYNSRLQPLTIGLGSSTANLDRLRLDYDYGAWNGDSEVPGPLPNVTSNNGNIGRITITPGTGPSMSQYFRYDELNRLKTAREYASGSGSGAAPALLSATPGNQQVTLSWSAVSGATGYRVKRGTASGSYSWTSGVITATSFTDTGLTNDTTYYYAVIAIVNGVDSANSNELSATPANSTGLGVPALQSASAGNQQVSLIWTSAANAASYTVKRGTASGGPYPVTVPGLTGTTYTDLNVTNGTAYYYVVSAVSATGVESANSNQLSATPSATAAIPVAPTNLVATVLSSTSIQLTWTDNSSDETAFEVLRAPAGTGSYQVVSGALPPNTTTWTNTGVTPGASYDYIVRAARNGVYSANSNTVNVTANSCSNTPSTPSSLTGTAYSMVQINLTWTDTSTNETGFSVERKTGTGAYSVIGTAAANATTYQDTAVSPGMTYQYRIRAANTCGYSGYSNSVSRTTPTQPQPPLNVTVTALSWQSIRIDWTDNSVEEIGFRLKRRIGANGTWVDLPNTVPANATSFVDTGLTPNTTYYYRVASLGPGGTATSPFIPTLANPQVGATTHQAPGSDTIGIYNATDGTWFLRDSNSAGASDAAFYYGPAASTWTPLEGDFDGDGDDTIGLYDPASGYFFLRNTNGPGVADLQFSYGPGGFGWQPVIGDWNGDGTDTVGLYDPSAGAFYLKNANSAGAADVVFYFGAGGLGWKPLAGDWNSDGTDSIGLYDPSNGNFFLKNLNTYGAADVTFSFGLGGWTALAGDWNGDGLDTIGLHDPATGTFYLKNTNDYGLPDLTFGYGPANVQPVAGDWDNTGQLRPAVKRAGERGSGEGVDARPAGDGGESARGGNGTGARRRRGAGRATEATMSWNQEFDYDRYGNRTWNGATTSNVQGPAITIDATTNRINTVGYQYDHAGNMTVEPGKTHQYDAMNKIWKTTIGSGSGATTVTMVYDALGQRVKKIVQVGQAAATTTRFVYGMGGKLVAEHTTSAAPGSPSKEYVYGPTGLAATVDNPSTAGRVVKYLTPDHLGSPRIVTGGTSGAATVVSRHDYLPFGEELFAAPNGQPGIGGRTTGQGYAAATQTDGVRQQFTSKERDAETGLDYFGARYYRSDQGRFNSVDPLLVSGEPRAPKSWNRYIYGKNNPLRFNDPTGLLAQDPINGGPTLAYQESQRSHSERTPITGFKFTPLGPEDYSFSEQVDVVAPADAIESEEAQVQGVGGGLPQGFSMGYTVGGSAGAGAFMVGASADVALATGQFVNLDEGTVDTGVLLNSDVNGGFAGLGGDNAGNFALPDVQDSARLNAGGWAGVGGGMWVSNAPTVKDMAGPFRSSFQLNLPFAAAQLDFGDNGVKVLTVTTGKGAGLGFSLKPTNTTVLSEFRSLSPNP